MPYFPPVSKTLPPAAFEQLIAQNGQRLSWMRSRTCPCVYGGAGPFGKLPTPGSAARGCTQCFGIGTYWDDPTPPFISWISFMHLSTAPDEPGVNMDPQYGVTQHADPTVTIPYNNPYLPQTSPAQPQKVWENASLNDIFIPVDMLARFNAVLQNGGQTILPYQQNLQIAPSGAVTIWDPISLSIEFVSGYTVSGASVLLPSGYAPQLSYMVEFQAAPLYVAFRHAGGTPHVRPFGGGSGLVNEPRRFRLQTLDFWTRQRGVQPTAPGSVATSGAITPFATMIGQPVQGAPVA